MERRSVRAAKFFQKDLFKKKEGDPVYLVPSGNSLMVHFQFESLSVGERIIFFLVDDSSYGKLIEKTKKDFLTMYNDFRKD